MKISFIAFLLISVFCSCKKEKPATPKIYDLSFYTEPLAYVQLPLHSYFIYKDSATGALDSVVVTQSSLEKQYESSRATSSGLVIPAYYYQSFTLLLTKYGTTQEDWFYGETIDPPVFFFSGPFFDSLSFLILEERDRVTNANISQVFKWSTEMFRPGMFNVDSIIPTLVIEGKTYLNVLYVYDSNYFDSTNENYRSSSYYWVKNLGIIKREKRTYSSIKTEFLVRNG